jgi:ribosome-binding protein aMBF1 (putative translation factor)
MERKKTKRLQANGWQIGSATDFLNLSPEEAALLDTKLALGQALKQRRLKQHLSQQALAQQLKSSQSRVAKMEAGDASVSLDLLFKSLFRSGATQKDVAKAMLG